MFGNGSGDMTTLMTSVRASMRVCACDVWRTMIAEADAAFVDIQDPGPRQPHEKGREAG